MKTFALVFLSLFMSKSCQSKKEMVDKTETVKTEVLESKPTAEIVKTETVKTEVLESKSTAEIAKTETNETSLPEKATQQNGTVAIYEAMSRGYFTKIVFKNNKLSVSKDRNNTEKGEAIKITTAEALEINRLLKAVKPQTLPDLKWPTEKRFYDGAPHANLTIIQNGETFVGGGFDHGFPPAEIKKLVSKLISIAEKK